MIRHGVDLVHVPRLREAMERHEAFAERVFTEEERRYCRARPDPYTHFAARFAAKEATLKALRRGLFSGGVDRALREIEVAKAGDAPRLVVTGTTLAAARRLGPFEAELSLSHAGDYAIASVLLVVG